MVFWAQEHQNAHHIPIYPHLDLCCIHLFGLHAGSRQILPLDLWLRRDWASSTAPGEACDPEVLGKLYALQVSGNCSVGDRTAILLWMVGYRSCALLCWQLKSFQRPLGTGVHSGPRQGPLESFAALLRRSEPPWSVRGVGRVNDPTALLTPLLGEDSPSHDSSSKIP